MEFIRQEGNNLIVENLFNEEHTLQLLSALAPTFTSITFRNVGVKIMKLIIASFEEVPVTHITIDYDWNKIMMQPKLVCYDKTQWKTLQQLHNWNHEWMTLFSNCYFLTSVAMHLQCSWMDEEFAKQFLGGVSKVPNIRCVKACLGSKCKGVEDILCAVSKANIFEQYEHNFRQLS